MLALVALCALPAVLGQSNAYTVSTTYTCTNYTGTTCLAWSQRGSIGTSLSCFPGSAVVLTERGPKPMKDVQIGDSVLGFDEHTGLNSFSRVRAWLHRFPAVEAEFVTITTQDGDITLSPFHNVAVVNTDGTVEYVYAKEVRAGNTLYRATSQTNQPSSTRVLSANYQTYPGIFAPFTELSNLYVGSNADGVFLAHSFAHVSSVGVISPIVHTAMTVAELFNEKIHQLPTNENQEYVHPVAQTLAVVFPSLVKAAPSSHSHPIISDITFSNLLTVSSRASIF